MVDEVSCNKKRKHGKLVFYPLIMWPTMLEKVVRLPSWSCEREITIERLCGFHVDLSVGVLFVGSNFGSVLWPNRVPLIAHD